MNVLAAEVNAARGITALAKGPKEKANVAQATTVQVVAASAVLGITAPVKGPKEKANVVQATIVPVAVACVAAALTVQVIDHGKHETIPS